jgi:periplasmic protein TonB
MFNLVQGTVDRPFHDRKTAPAAVSMLVHVAVLGVVLAVPYLYVTNQMPQVPEMMAFVVASEARAPAHPPPPPAARPVQVPVPTQSVVTASPPVAPIQAPAEIKPEPPRAAELTEIIGVPGGGEGGVVGGVVGGVTGGVMGGLLPPLPASPPAPGPVRIGGQVKAPALLHRVEPVYPDIAVLAKVTGVVILEATVGTDGAVTSVRVLQMSRGPLDKAAVDAVKQWQYSPLVLNGIPTSFVLTVTLNFSLSRG